MEKKTPQAVVDSRHLKILAAKKDDLKDSVVFVCLHEEKYGYYDIAQLRKLAENLEKIEPSGRYLIGLKDLRVNIFDKSEVKNRDLIITVEHPPSLAVDKSEVEESFRQAFSEARSLKFVHHYATVARDNP